MNKNAILKICDHTVLRTDAAFGEIAENCRLAMEHGCASICLAPIHVFAAKALCGERLPVCTVVGFPNGYNDTATKVFEARHLIEEGADELDMVVNLADAATGDYAAIAKELSEMRRASRGKILKVIVECCSLPEGALPELCRIVSDSGADFIKTSTGFGSYGARIEDVESMRRYLAPETKIKAAGGISSFEDAQRFIDAGADRLGTRRLLALMNDR